jgi:uncharacterized protein YqhQ
MALTMDSIREKKANKNMAKKMEKDTRESKQPKTGKTNKGVVNHFTVAMWGILGLVLGFALGNFLPDFSDVIYFTAVANGSIIQPDTAIGVFYVPSAVFWGIILGFLAIGFTFKWFGVRFAVWLVCGIIITSTILIAVVVNPLISGWSLWFDVLLSIAAFFSIIYVEYEFRNQMNRKKGK